MAPPSLRRIPRGEFSCFRGTMECSETDRPSRLTRSTRSAIPPCACPSFPEASSTTAQGLEDSGAAPPGRSLEVETTGSPKFPEDPKACMPCSPTPARPRHQASPLPCAGRPGSMFSSVFWFGLPSFPRRRLSRSDKISGLNHTAYKLAVYASCPGGAPQITQDSLQVGGQPLPDGLGPHRAKTRPAGSH
jgi:hypothetical protein